MSRRDRVACGRIWLMPKKKSIKNSAREFNESVDQILDFFAKTDSLKEPCPEWSADYAVIRLYIRFEVLMLDTISGAINNDSRTIAETAGMTFPRHMSVDVCRYFIIGTGFFDFKGRDGLIAIVKKYVPDTHYLLKLIRDTKYRQALEQLSALRNLAAHLESKKAKTAAKAAIGGEKIGSAGAWLRKQDRFGKLCGLLKKFSHAIEKQAPY